MLVLVNKREERERERLNATSPAPLLGIMRARGVARDIYRSETSRGDAERVYVIGSSEKVILLRSSGAFREIIG